MSADNHSETLFVEPLYLVLPKDHPLAGEDFVTMKAMKGLEVLAMSPNFHLHRQIHELCDVAGARGE